ncbi:MAG TPA: hypothetical protein VMW50_02980 [Dehalococcoidia bacterium]|nr:hypothetical protein [Dehalococcoidia bacterium]
MSLKEEAKTVLNILIDGIYQRHGSQPYETLPELVEVLDEIREERHQTHYKIKMEFKEE